MDTSGTVQNPAQAAQSRILPLLDDLPEESLSVVEQFVRFLHEQAQRGMAVVAISEARGVEAKEERPPYRYPTVPMPASALDGLVGIMPPVGGDALADTESLYDEV